MSMTVVSEFGLNKKERVELINKGERDEDAMEIVGEIDEIIPNIVDVGNISLSPSTPLEVKTVPIAGINGEKSEKNKTGVPNDAMEVVEEMGKEVPDIVDSDNEYMYLESGEGDIGLGSVDYSMLEVSVDSLSDRDSIVSGFSCTDVTPPIVDIITPDISFQDVPNTLQETSSLCGSNDSNDEESQASQSSENDMSANNILKDIRIKNVNRLIIGTLNINFIAPKFEQLKEVIGNHLDIFTIQETKIDESFPNDQFEIEGYHKPYRLDRNKHGGGL